MELTEVDALRAYAKMINTLSVEPLESLLADDFAYESQTVFQALESKQAFLEYIIPKLQTIRRSNATVYAEMGAVAAYGKNQPCVILPIPIRPHFHAKAQGIVVHTINLDEPPICAYTIVHESRL